MKRKTLTCICGCHVLHDGLTDVIYVLLPFWQIAFDLTLTEVGLAVSSYAVALALLQIPAGLLAERIGERSVLVLGTMVAGLAFMSLALAGTFAALLGILIVAGAGSAVQHPLGSALVARAYDGGERRVAIGTYNFSGDLGKMAFPAMAALLLASPPWTITTMTLGGLAIAVALGIAFALPGSATGQERAAACDDSGVPRKESGIRDKGAFAILSSIGIVDTFVRIGLLTCLPFLMIDKDMSTGSTGLAFGLLFTGGAAGKFLCGPIAVRIGVIATVYLTECFTAAGILMLIVLPLGPTLIFLPLLGAAVNGTSTVLYGTVADFVTPRYQARAFGLFYTIILAASAGAPFVCGAVSDLASMDVSVTILGLLALSAMPLAWLLRTSVR